MKKIMILALVLCMILCGCAETEPQSPPVPAPEPVPSPQVSTTGEAYEKADKPLSAEVIAAIPIAREGMSSQQLRQICLSYMKLSVSCQWVSDGTYCIEEADKDNVEKNFTEGKLYGGIPYINMASGNLYRFMEYYDPETGVLDSSGLRKNPELFATACSGTAGWAWARVVNSAEVSWTHSLNASHGLIPVGPYEYDLSIEEFWEWGKDGKKIIHHDTKKICKKNGEQVMYESYAQALLADCFSRTGHVAMAASEPVVVRDENGKIDGKKSYIDIAEQGQYTKAAYHLRTTADGTEYRIRGNDGRPFTFAELYEKGFLVHTFKEFLGTDPVEKAWAKLEHTGDTATAQELATGDITANYPISDIFTKVYDEQGAEVCAYVGRTVEHFIVKTPAASYLPVEQLENYQTGGYTVKITAQLSNGEIVPVYTGKLSG